MYAHFSSKVELFLSFVERSTDHGDLDVFNDPGSPTRSASAPLGRQVETLMPADPDEAGVLLELRAFALRNPRARRAIAARLREQMDEVEEEHPDGLEFDPQVALQFLADHPGAGVGPRRAARARPRARPARHVRDGAGDDRDAGRRGDRTRRRRRHRAVALADPVPEPVPTTIDVSIVPHTHWDRECSVGVGAQRPTAASVR